MSIAAILNALIAIPKIMGYVESFAASITLWYCQRAQTHTLQAIADAAALGARAKTDEDRYHVAKAWSDALSRPRITPN